MTDTIRKIPKENEISPEMDEIPPDTDLQRQYKEENYMQNEYNINRGYQNIKEGQQYQIMQNNIINPISPKYKEYQLTHYDQKYQSPSFNREYETIQQNQGYNFYQHNNDSRQIYQVLGQPQIYQEFQSEEYKENQSPQIDQERIFQIIQNNQIPIQSNENQYIQIVQQENLEGYQMDQNGNLYKIDKNSLEPQGINPEIEYSQSNTEEQIYQLNNPRNMENNAKKKNNAENKKKIKKNKEPKDSLSKMLVKSKGFENSKNAESSVRECKGKSIVKNIPPLISFQKISLKKIKEPKAKSKRENFVDFVEIPREEYSKHVDTETIFFEEGMNTGQYTFRGKETILEQKNVPKKIEITADEINEELTKRTNRKKEKKIKYEVMDKFFTLTEFERKIIKENEPQQNENEEPLNNENIENNNNIEPKQEEAEKEKEEGKNQNQNNKYNINESNSPMDNYSKYLLEQINKLRIDPQSFIGVIEDAKANIVNSRFGGYTYNGKIKIALSEGEPAFDEAIEFLKTTESMEILEYSPSLTVKLPQNESEISDNNDLKIKVEEMVDNGINVKSYWRDVIRDPEISFLLMIVDDTGLRRGMKRKDILDPKMKYIGISSIEINGNFVCYITLSSKLKI